MGFLNFLKGKPAKEHRSSLAPSARQRSASRKRRTGQIKALWKLSRRKATMQFVEANKALLVANKYTYKGATANVGGTGADVYQLVKYKFHLFDMCVPMRKYCGAPLDHGKELREARCPAPVAEALRRIACPTAILGLLARISQRDGFEKASAALHFLERACADPEKYAGSLLALADRYDMVPPPPVA